MTLLWMDGFDHYGVDTANTLDGVYAEVAGTTSISSTRARTGTYSLRDGGTTSGGAARRIFGAAKITVGVGLVAWLDNLPATNDKYALTVFCDTANVPQILLAVQSTGKLSAYRCSGTSTFLGALLAESTDGIFTAGAFQHVEFKATANQSAGTVECRVNGVTVLSASSLDTVASANVEYSQVRICAGIGTENTALPGLGSATYIDDLFAWDPAGAQNVDFQGDRRVRTFFPSADTAVAEMTLNGAASGYACINQASPDEDTTYLSASPPAGSPLDPVVSEFGMEDPPAGVGAISAVQTYVRMRKSEAGVATLQASMLSGSSASNGAEHAITEQYTYWMDVHELDPNTGTPWSESSLTSAKLRLSRVE